VTSTAPAAAAPPREERGITYGHIKRASFCHSAAYLSLLAAWAYPGDNWTETLFGYAHGLGWFAMIALSLIGLRKRILPFGLAALVSIGGAVGPFLGSLAFVIRDRRRAMVRDRPHGD
jgi:hypothetical protein